MVREILKLSENDIVEEIWKIKRRLGERLVILGHHYQRDDVIQFADFRGDSLGLAKSAAKLNAKYIIFCGVHFMAEVADMLTTNNQSIILPEMRAGCSMANMATKGQIEKAWTELTAATNEKIIPVTYINCTAELKAFVGERGGAICTSSNAKEIVSWALKEGPKLLFFPDQHLGRNTCYDLGISLDEMVVYDPRKKGVSLTDQQIRASKVILWYGCCSVHQKFTVQDVEHTRQSYPDSKIIVHPECCFDVVNKSDMSGPTSFILEKVMGAPATASFTIGTEANLVRRISKLCPDKIIRSLASSNEDKSLCPTMNMIKPASLLLSLRDIEKESLSNVIKVQQEIKEKSLMALDKMLLIGG